MQTRRAWVLIGILALCCVGFLLSVIYPVGSATPHGETPSAERFWVADTESYSMTGEIIVDGDRQFGFEELVTASGERYQRVDDSETTTERYQPTPNATIYEQVKMSSDANVDRMREQIESDGTQELLEENRSEDRVTFIVATSGSDPAVDFANPAAVVVQTLHAVGYERVNDESAARVVYEPQAGWYGGSQGYRITNTTGEIRVDAETDAVEVASVSWDATNPADSYAQYIITRVTSSDPTYHEVSLELQPEEPEVPRLSWTPEM